MNELLSFLLGRLIDIANEPGTSTVGFAFPNRWLRSRLLTGFRAVVGAVIGPVVFQPVAGSGCQLVSDRQFWPRDLDHCKGPQPINRSNRTKTTDDERQIDDRSNNHTASKEGSRIKRTRAMHVCTPLRGEAEPVRIRVCVGV
jgi:hypothetical protein